jgi:hypothetical protein
LALCACQVGTGSGSLDGTLFIRPCTSDSDFGSSPTSPRAYHMNPQFFAANPIDGFPGPHPVNRISVRVQASGNRVEEADVMGITIANDLEVAQMVGTPIEVGPATNVRATLNLNITCPDAGAAMELDGTMTWVHFGSAAPPDVPEDFRIDFDDRLAATVSFDVVDRRALTLGGLGGVPTEPSVFGHLNGTFDFIVHEGRAAQSP